MKTIFTTGQVAKICKVAPRTASKWFDSGRLRGYRIPGSQHRRVEREHLIRFLKEHGMPLGELEDRFIYVFAILKDQTNIDGIFDDEDDFQCRCFENPFAAVSQIAALAGDARSCVVLDLDFLQEKALPAIQSFKELSSPPKIVGFGNSAIDHEGCDKFILHLDPDLFRIDVRRLFGLKV
jgi:excisionase family DNA binding protein